LVTFHSLEALVYFFLLTNAPKFTQYVVQKKTQHKTYCRPTLKKQCSVKKGDTRLTVYLSKISEFMFTRFRSYLNVNNSERSVLDIKV
jgi:hypothetical protein